MYAAYNAAPPLAASDEVDWYGLLRDEPLIRGLELSYNGGVHPAGAGHLRSLLDPRWQNVVTSIPGTIAAVARDATYGLASAHPEGRAAALADVQGLFRDVVTLDSVIAVELHSAPGTSPAALVDSLAEIVSWDWGSVRIVIEHADARIDDHEPQKGWMSLPDEIAAVAAVPGVGHTINWGRSAIETRSAHGPVEHLRLVAGTGRLAGFMVSGASGLPTARSEPWQDVHLALDTIEPESLLTTAALAEALDVVRGVDLDYLGVKVGGRGDTLAERLAPGLATLRALDQAWSTP